ncbi:MAG: cadherin-like domain-containing protein, partial [Actinobacteria bacterium]|nr:cadherin-like domain-containing protein [Actinomycetota bacterium]
MSAALTALGQGPASAAVTGISGSALGYYTDVSLFGGPAQREGAGQVPCNLDSNGNGIPGSPADCFVVAQGGSPTTSASPSVVLPSGGGNVSDANPNGAIAQYGPAKLFSGQYPNAANDPGQSAPSPPSGPLDVNTQGTLAGGSVTSTATISKGTQGTVDPTQPRGVGPGPVVADALSSTCTASESGLSASTTITNGILVLSTDSGGAALSTIPVPANPPPNWTRSGVITNVGDSFTAVYNEQIISQDSITVNAVHLYLLGPTARGELVEAQSHCAVTATTPDTPPVANNDAYSATAGKPLTVAAPGLLANDSDPLGKPMTATNAPVTTGTGTFNYSFPGAPAHGVVTINPDGSLTYLADRSYSGTDSFKYVARDARGANAPATVTLTVAPAPRQVIADFTGDAKTDVSIFRPASGAWFLRGASPEATGYGTNGDVPVAGDYDGDAKADIAVYRPSQGVWYIHKSGGGDVALGYGASGDIPVPGDYDGDGKTDIAVFRPSQGVWYIHNSTGADTAVGYGGSGDIPVPGDYDGDGKTDIAVFRPSQGVWYIHNSTGADTAV